MHGEVEDLLERDIRLSLSYQGIEAKAPKVLAFTQRSLAQEGKDDALVPVRGGRCLLEEISRVLANCSKDCSRGSEGQR